MVSSALSDTSDRHAGVDGDVEQDALDTALDEALAETFPASDPVAIHVDVADSKPGRVTGTSVQQVVPASDADRHPSSSAGVERPR